MVSPTKQHILDNAGFFYNFDRKLYVNRKTKKIFSVEYIEDHDEKSLEDRISEDTGASSWQFYSNVEPPESVKREIEAVLG